MITKLLKSKRFYFDGGTGTLLQSMGLTDGEAPERWNISHPDRITALHEAYLDAGSDIICTNTFGINRDKFSDWEQLITAGIECAKKAVNGRMNKFIAFDMGPTGRLLEPLGELSFEDAVELFAANVRVAAENGADLILIETMNDAYETKAAVVAAKENCNLPIFVTNVYDENGHLMTGADPAAMVALLEGLRVNALGINCSLGPDKMIPVVKKLIEYSSLPVIVSPNAGLPESINGNAVYNVNSDDFSDKMREIAILGASVLGGCCGTTPEFIKKTVEKTAFLPFLPVTQKGTTLVSSYTHTVTIGDSPVLIGERINPTGKSKFKEALRQDDLNYIIGEGIKQADAGVHILDVNVGLPEIDEAAVMTAVVSGLQAVCDLPLQIDTSDSSVLEKALCIYNGKALVNSVNGDEKSMDAVFPLVKKYGGVIIALTLDKSGIPDTAQGRLAIAEKIISYASAYGISKNDIIVDPLALAVSSDSKSALLTLETVKLLKSKGIKTSLGISNISFGLPRRELINSVFFANALENGLDCAIMNPFSEKMMDVYYSFNALSGFDTACADYISYAAEIPDEKVPQNNVTDLKTAVIKGLRESAVDAARELLDKMPPLEIINQFIIPALNETGTAFEQKKLYLPQLLMSADAASAAFGIVKEKMPPSAAKSDRKVILATVKGDIHDIGKNIVKAMLESYGFCVIDLGRDVEPQTVLDSVNETGCRLIGLSALMTTTVPAMEKTIALLHNAHKGIFVIVGGAVLNPEYAEMIDADKYAKDAMETVRFAEKFYK